MPDLLSDWLPVTSAVSIPYFCSARPQRALPFKEGAHILSYVYQFQGGLLKELVALMRAGGERGDS